MIQQTQKPSKLAHSQQPWIWELKLQQENPTIPRENDNWRRASMNGIDSISPET